MKKHRVLFIHGGGENGYLADQPLVTALKKESDKRYEISDPQIQGDPSAPDFGWLEALGEIWDQHPKDPIVVAHSFGAALLLKFFSENELVHEPAGIFLLAAPFWTGLEDWQQGIRLQSDFSRRLPQKSLLFFYHNRDDQEIGLDNLALYREQLPAATFVETDHGGHQFENGLSLVARDIKNSTPKQDEGSRVLLV